MQYLVHRVEGSPALGRGNISDIRNIFFLVSDGPNSQMLSRVCDIYIKWLTAFSVDFPGRWWVPILGVPHCHLPLLLCTDTKDSGEDTSRESFCWPRHLHEWKWLGLEEPVGLQAAHTWLSLSRRLAALRGQAPSEELGTNAANSDHPPSPFLKPVKAKGLNDTSEKKEAGVVAHHSNEVPRYVFCTSVWLRESPGGCSGLPSSLGCLDSLPCSSLSN